MIPSGKIMLNPRTHSTDYPDSYYRASLRDRAGFPRLEGEVRSRVCVIGGGFSGVSTALELAERGVEVVLLEAYRIGWGASGRNGGQLIRGIGHGLEQFRGAIGQAGIDAIEQMGFEAVDIVRERIDRYGIDCDLVMGHCCLALKPRHLRAFEEELQHLQRIGYQHDIELVERARLHTIIGSDAYLGGLVDRGSGHLHPLNLVVGEARAAAHQGAVLFERSPVTAIEEGRQVRVKTEGGTVIADTLVICGNAYVRGLNKVLEGTVLPAGSYLIATEPLGEALQRQVLPTNLAMADESIALDYYRLSADGRMIFGGLCTYSGRDPRSIVDVMQPKMAKVFPALKAVKIDYQWGGLMGIGANRLPQIGRLRDNLYYAQAYAGHGLAAAHLAGRVIAEAIGGDDKRLGLFEQVKHLRFPGGRSLRSPLLALGMAYYRFLDLF